MAYKAFSNPKNIDKMVRNIEIWPEQETLEVTLFQNKETPYQNFNHWVKYVSTDSQDKFPVYIYWDTKIQDEFLVRIHRNLLRNEHYFKSMCKRFLAYYRRFDFFTRKIQKRPARYYQKLSEKELIKLFQTLISYLRPALVGYYIVFDLTDLLLRFVEREVNDRFPESGKLFEELCTVGVHSDLRIKSGAKEKQKVATLLKPLKRYPDLYMHVLWLRQMMGYRNKETAAIYVHYEQARKFFNEISRRLGIHKDDFRYISREEILSGLKKKTDVQSIVEERKKKGFVIKQVGRKIRVMTGVNPEDLHEGKISGKSTEISGNPAFTGNVVGKVQIILNPTMARIETDDVILVTHMTTPDFVPLMKKARAIVTDEGGLLCHAAIVARELKKPCIIGTKIATKVFKNGDQVEVDAQAGIVRKITT